MKLNRHIFEFQDGEKHIMISEIKLIIVLQKFLNGSVNKFVNLLQNTDLSKNMVNYLTWLSSVRLKDGQRNCNIWWYRNWKT